MKHLWAIEYKGKGRKPVIMSELKVPLLFATRRDARDHLRQWGTYLLGMVKPVKVVVTIKEVQGE